MPETTDYVDVQIQFRPANEPAPVGLRTTHDVVATINGGGNWRAQTTIDREALDQLESDPEAYGLQLGEWLFPAQLSGALAQARGLKERPVRVRLVLEMGPNCERGPQHLVRWERARILIDGQPRPLAITPGLPFSRYVAFESLDPDVSDDTTLRVLLAFANPKDLDAGLVPVAVEQDCSKLLDGLAPLVQSKQFKLSVITGGTVPSDALRARLTALNAEIVPGFATRELIAKTLPSCQGLHLVAHGVFNAANGQGSLLLEDDKGGKARALDTQLQSWIHPGLRFVVLQSCQTGAAAPTGGPPFVGVGPTLVASGVPAVIAMQDFMPMDDARVFAAAFYGSLLHGGIVDAAVNDGRRAIYRKPQDDSYSIPVLFMRLRNGVLWRPDPVRKAVSAQLAEFDKRRTHELPMRAVLTRHTRKLDWDPQTGPAGPVFDMPQKLEDVCRQEKARVLLVGSRGMEKGAQIRRLYQLAAARYLDDVTAPAPIFLTSRNIFDAGDVWKAINRCLRLDPDDGSNVWAERQLLLIVDGDEELGDDKLAQVLTRLKEFVQQATAHRLLFSLDDRVRDNWDPELELTAVLVAQPMDFSRVLQFLGRTSKPLRDIVELRQCRDIAGTPWLLDRMIRMHERGAQFDSRASLLAHIAGECLPPSQLNGIPRQCAERALEQIAWRILFTRDATLGGSDLFEILRATRGKREFDLTTLREKLIGGDLLAVAGDDAVRFRYQSLLAYYAARYLMSVPAPERRRLLEDITASLGRLPRARWWEKTLVTLAGLEDVGGREHVLSGILAGSTLADGEQVYLAARCYTDTRDPKAPSGVVDQIVDALIWRSHPGNLRPYADRRRAVVALTELQHKNAVPHLVRLATEEIASNWTGKPRYEFSGIRLIATNGLLLMPDEATQYVLENKPELTDALKTWRTADETHLEPLVAELKANKPATSPIAAFALGLFTADQARSALLDSFADPGTNPEVGWAIADTFANMDPEWVVTHVLKPRLTQFEDPRIAYLVGRTAMADPGLSKYLEQCLSCGNPAVQARALRALGELQRDGVREICEAIVADTWDKAQGGGLALKKPAGHEDLSRFLNVSIEALRSVGTLDSINVLREARQHDMLLTLRQLSFDVTEDIYWRLTGGLSQEDFNPAGHTTP